MALQDLIFNPNEYVSGQRDIKGLFGTGLEPINGDKLMNSYLDLQKIGLQGKMRSPSMNIQQGENPDEYYMRIAQEMRKYDPQAAQEATDKGMDWKLKYMQYGKPNNEKVSMAANIFQNIDPMDQQAWTKARSYVLNMYPMLAQMIPEIANQTNKDAILRMSGSTKSQVAPQGQELNNKVGGLISTLLLRSTQFAAAGDPDGASKAKQQAADLTKKMNEGTLTQEDLMVGFTQTDPNAIANYKSRLQSELMDDDKEGLIKSMPKDVRDAILGPVGTADVLLNNFYDLNGNYVPDRAGGLSEEQLIAISGVPAGILEVAKNKRSKETQSLDQDLKSKKLAYASNATALAQSKAMYDANALTEYNNNPDVKLATSLSIYPTERTLDNLIGQMNLLGITKDDIVNSGIKTSLIKDILSAAKLKNAGASVALQNVDVQNNLWNILNAKAQAVFNSADAQRQALERKKKVSGGKGTSNSQGGIKSQAMEKMK